MVYACCDFQQEYPLKVLMANAIGAEALVPDKELTINRKYKVRKL